MAIVYLHKRNDTNEVFYVGMGAEEKRAFVKCKRNPYWKHIVNKVGYSVNIIHKDIDWEEAKNIEILLIEKYGRKDLGLGNLVNMTDGGDGCFGLVQSKEAIQKIREAKKGKTRSEEFIQKISEINKGKKHSEEAKQKISIIQQNREGVKGYYFNKSRKKYQAQIKVGGKKIQLGRFDTREEASQAYQKARLIYFV